MRRQMSALVPAMEIADFDAPHFLLQHAPEEAAGRVLAFLERIDAGMP